ncbi:MAG: hypothetical protein ACRDVN_13335 [Jiangellaceae bacterium]
MGAVDRAKRGLAKIGGAAALVEIGRQVWPVVRPAVKRGRDNAAAWRIARAHAARVLDGSYLDVFVGGVKHWVVWSGDEPVAAYPAVDGDLGEAVRTVDGTRRRRPGARRTTRSGSSTRNTPTRRGDHW